MPITAEYQWEETNAAVSVLVPLRGAKPSTSDVFVASVYLKVNSTPYFLELDLAHPITAAKSRAVFEPQGLRLFLPKEQPGKWGSLCTELDKEPRLERREEAVEARHEELRQDKVAEKEEKVSDDREALKRSMELENAKKQWVADKKAAEYSKNEDEILNWEDKEQAAAAMLLEDEEAPCSSEAAASSTRRRKKASFPDANLPPPRCSNVVKMRFTKTTRPTPARADNADKLGPNDPERSKPVLKRVTNPDSVDIGEQNPVWLKDRADKYVQVGDYRSAEAAYSAAIALDDDEYVDTIANRVASYYSNRALCHMQLGSFEQSQSDCERAMELLREYGARNRHELSQDELAALLARNSRLHARRAAARAQLGDVDGSRCDFEEALKQCTAEHREGLERDMHKLGALAHKLEADAAVKTGEFKQALESYGLAKQIDPANTALYSNSALCHLALKQYESCVQQCTMCIGLLEKEAGVKPEQWGKILARRGSAYAELQQVQQALQDYERASSLLPGNKQLRKDRDRIAAELHRAAADQSFGEGEMELALAEYELGLSLQPEDGKMIANKSTCLLQLRRYQECVQSCDAALDGLQAKPKMKASVLVRRGTALGKLGQFSAGVDDLRAAIELVPAFAESLKGDLELMERAVQ